MIPGQRSSSLIAVFSDTQERGLADGCMDLQVPSSPLPRKALFRRFPFWMSA